MRINSMEMRRRLSSDRNLASVVKPDNNSGLASKLGSAPQNPDGTNASLYNPLNPGPKPGVQHETIDHGHRRGCPNVPEPIREVIGALGELNSYKDVARSFNVSIPTVSFAVSGEVGGKPANKDRKDAVVARRLSIEDIALTKLMKSLDLIDDDKMENCSAKELSQVSSNLAKVSQSMRDSTGSIGNQTNIVVYSPERRSEDTFKVVDV